MQQTGVPAANVVVAAAATAARRWALVGASCCARAWQPLIKLCLRVALQIVGGLMVAGGRSAPLLPPATNQLARGYTN